MSKRMWVVKSGNDDGGVRYRTQEEAIQKANELDNEYGFPDNHRVEEVEIND